MKRVIRRWGVILLALLLLGPSAGAEGWFRLESTIYAALRGEEIDLCYERTSGKREGDLILLDAQGVSLGKAHVRASDRLGAIAVSVPEDAPALQTLRLLFRQDGKEYPQGECLLAADSPDRDAVRRGSPDKKRIALTFDAAWGPGRLTDLLAVLERHHARCTFFLQGGFVTRYPDLTAEIHRRGHELGNHSMYHPGDMRQESDERIYLEINACNQAIQAVTGEPVALYRPPSGYYSYRDRAICRALGCEMILWTFDSMDGFLDTSTQETVWNALTRHSVPGAIILMHIYGYYNPEILDVYLPMMQARGYAFVTVSELLAASQED